MNTFKYNEYDIIVNANGAFSAVRNGVTLTAGPLTPTASRTNAGSSPPR